MSATYEPPTTLNGHHPHHDPEPDADDVQGTDRHGRPFQVYNLRYLPKWATRRNGTDQNAERDTAGGVLLAVASVLLLLLAVAQGYVSFRAQYAFVHEIKREHLASMLEALGLDAAAVIFALLALAQARLGRQAVAERVLNFACVAGSLTMNALSADATSVKSVAAWTLPAALYAAASDRLIAVVRRRALAGRPGADDDTSPLAAARGMALWVLRLAMAPPSTIKGLRAWVLEEAPTAPGRRAAPANTAGRTLPALPAAIQPDTGADTPPASDRPRRSATGGRKSGHRAASATDRQADKARALLTAEPSMTGAELGRRLKVSERTGRRLHVRATAQLAAHPTPETTDAALTDGESA